MKMAKVDPTDSLTQLLLPRELTQVLERRGVVARIQLSDLAGEVLGAAQQSGLVADLRAAHQKFEHLRRLASIGALAAGVTHEARNLLTGSLGFAQLLQSKSHDSAAVVDTARTIEHELRRCVEVVASFLKLSRAGMEPTRDLEVAEIVRPVERLVAHYVRQHGCSLRVEVDEGLPKILGRVGDLQRVLINLIVNAADAAHMPGVHIMLSAQRNAAGCVEVRVVDDGPGVPPAIAERIFEPFFSTKEAGEGTGLGLSISRSVAEAHGGQLVLEPTLTPGAAFVLRLPVAGCRLDGRPFKQESPA
jgi:two-component system NtrC family sensor kinase